MNLSAINCRTFRRTSKQYQNLIHCKQTQNERKGHSRKYPHRQVQIWTCHTQTVEVHVSRFHYAASREPGPRSSAQLSLLLLFDTKACSVQVRERFSYLVYIICRKILQLNHFSKNFLYFFSFRRAYARQIIDGRETAVNLRLSVGSEITIHV